MPILLDRKPLHAPKHITKESTIGDTLKWANTALAEGRIIIKIELDGKLLEGPALAHAHRDTLGTASLALTSADRKELSLTILGKLAALIQWLTPQHRDVAGLFERGETQKALERLQGLIANWHQIQDAYGNLAKMLDISPAQLPIQEVTGETVLNEFCEQLTEIQTALQNRDFVMLADILQYEMDGAVANWMKLLEATLGVVEPVPA